MLVETSGIGIYTEYREMPEYDCECDDYVEPFGKEYWFVEWDLPNEYRSIRWQDWDYRGFAWDEEIDGWF